MQKWKNMKITPETHKLLEEMKIELTPKKESNLSFDKVIAYLIGFYKQHKKEA